MVKKPAPAIARQISEVEKLRSGITNLASALRASELRTARLEGYISRIHEVEARAAGPVVEPSDDGIDKLRVVLGNSTSEEADHILEAISPELLDRVLGKMPAQINKYPAGF